VSKTASVNIKEENDAIILNDQQKFVRTNRHFRIYASDLCVEYGMRELSGPVKANRLAEIFLAGSAYLDDKGISIIGSDRSNNRKFRFSIRSILNTSHLYEPATDYPSEWLIPLSPSCYPLLERD
jgi:hypothetical protein